MDDMHAEYNLGHRLVADRELAKAAGATHVIEINETPFFCRLEKKGDVNIAETLMERADGRGSPFWRAAAVMNHHQAVPLDSPVEKPKSMREFHKAAETLANRTVDEPQPSAAGFLHAALKHMEDRAATYDKPEGERSMGATVSAFQAVTGITLTEEQGWLFMILLKAVRTQQGGYRADNYEDGAAYFGLCGEAASKERV